MATPSTRLTKNLRSKISSRILDFKYADNGAVLEMVEEAASIANAVYDELFDAKKKALVDSLPEGWMLKSSTIGARFGFDVTQLSFNGDLSELCRTWSDRKIVAVKDLRNIERRVPTNMGGYRYSSAIDVDFEHNHELTSRFNKLNNKLIDFLDTYKKDQLSIDTTLNSFTTASKLMEQWPEAKPFVLQVIGNVSAPVKSTALAISREELNERFGLPVPELA